MKPLYDRVLVAPDPIPETTKSGLAIVEDWPQETTGTVTAVGSTVRDVAVGDHIVFPQSVGQELHVNETRLFMMRERDVLAILGRTA